MQSLCVSLDAEPPSYRLTDYSRVLKEEKRSLYQKLYDDTQYVHSEGAKYPGYCEPQQVKYADCGDSRAGTLDPRKHNDWLGGVRDVGEISRYGLDSYLPNSTRSHQGPAWDMQQSMVFREGYWGASHSCLDSQFVDEQLRGKEHYSYHSFGRAGGLGHTNAVAISNIMEGEQNLNPLPFGPGGDRHLSGGPACPNLDNRDAHQALGSFHPPPSFQDDRLDAVRLRSNSGDNMSGTWSLVGKHQLRYPSHEKEPMSLIEAHACSESQLAYDPKGIPPTRGGGSQCSYNSLRGNEQGMAHGDISIPKDIHSGPISNRDSPGLSPRAQWPNSGWRPRTGGAGSMGEPPLSSAAANICRPLEQDRPAFFHYSGSSVPPFQPHPSSLHAQQEGFPQDLHFSFAMQNPPAGLQGRDGQRISNLPQTGRSSRPPACGSSSRTIRNWPKDREFLQRQVIPSHAEELFRLHNMKARMPSNELQRNKVPHCSRPCRNLTLKETGSAHEALNWDASSEENQDSVMKLDTGLSWAETSHHPQVNWEAINDDLEANNVSELQANQQGSPQNREEKELGLLLRAQQAASVCSRQFLKEMSEEDDDDDDDGDDDDLSDVYEEEDDDVSLGGSVASDDDGINHQHQPQMEENSDGDGKEEVKSKEEKAYEYFVKMFQDNHELRKLYEEKRNCGEFECLVCVGEGAKGKRKKFPDVVGLVQHSKKITKTKKLLEHRGYACAICYLLGWDSLGPPQFASHFSDLAPRGCIPPADSPCSLLEKPGSQEDLQDDEIRAQELSAKRAKLSADRIPEKE
ncbi:unnamed protein product [Sphagnum balticum]